VVDVAAAGARRLRDRDQRNAHDPGVPGGGVRPRGSGLAEVRGDRPALLPPDASKAKRKMGWEPKTKFKDLIELMVDADLADLRRQNSLFAFKAR